jgi:hypothetical protein
MRRDRVLVTGVLVALLASVSPAGVQADNAPMWESPEGLAPGIPNSRVQMAGETVRIAVHENAAGVVADVEASFDMLNPGPDAQMLVGFPNAAWEVLFANNRDAAFSPVTFQAIQNFRASSPLGQYAPAMRKVGGSGPFKDSSWFVWNMVYPGGKPLRVQVTYQQQLLSFNMYSSDYPAPSSLPVSYVLRTGALWDGPIGSAVITMSATDGGGVIPVLPATQNADGQLTWSMTNFEPTEDIEAVYVRGAKWPALKAAEASGSQPTASATDLVQNARTVLDVFVGATDSDLWLIRLAQSNRTPIMTQHYLPIVRGWVQRAIQAEPDNIAALELAGDLDQGAVTEKHGWLTCWPTAAAAEYQQAADLGSDVAVARLKDMQSNRDTIAFGGNFDDCAPSDA